MSKKLLNDYRLLTDYDKKRPSTFKNRLSTIDYEPTIGRYSSSGCRGQDFQKKWEKSGRMWCLGLHNPIRERRGGRIAHGNILSPYFARRAVFIAWVDTL
jgi:hypothetical protein